MDRQWKLGVDLHEMDNLFDGFTFDTVITALRCNERIVDKNALIKVVNEILATQRQDLFFLLKNNTDEIIRRAKKK